ncbi:hypothetical protein [Armatimonas rosea]|uniref:Putative membrane protein n=1 Tax=Armatimonas rosea TaxID=685828 RepID=A0A7W9SWC2_ARMRO|nr:hypothetical protein [Armatimonas rosea]MBB6054067.1 putative membrane protein [Armatimonas rosea]
MNPAYLHLVLNHLPVLGTWFGLLLLSAGFIFKSNDLKKASLVVFVLCALVAIPVFLTGEPAEGKIEGLPGVSEGLIEAHEAAAKFALILVEILGTASLLCLVFLQRGIRAASLVLLGVWGLALLTGGLFVYTAKLGGQIRHTEVRDPGSSGGVAASSSALDSGEENRKKGEHDDD